MRNNTGVYNIQIVVIVSMSNTLTLKQKKFLANIISGMTGTKAVMLAYGISNPNVAAVISSQNLRKLNIAKALDVHMDKYDLDASRALKVLDKALDATTTIKGKKMPDLSIQLQASDRVLRLRSII